jgi:hypothetical protein
MRAELEATYDAFLNSVDNRSFARCDTLSGEQIMAINIRGDQVAPTTAVLVFECKGTNKPHIRTVVLGREDGSVKWHVRSENTVTLPTVRPSNPEHVSTTSNTPETVPSLTSVTVGAVTVRDFKTIVQRIRKDWLDDDIEILVSLAERTFGPL